MKRATVTVPSGAGRRGDEARTDRKRKEEKGKRKEEKRTMQLRDQLMNEVRNELQYGVGFGYKEEQSKAGGWN